MGWIMKQSRKSTMASALSLCTLTPKLSRNRPPFDFSYSRTHFSLLSYDISSLTLTSRKSYASFFISKSTVTEAAVSVVEFETDYSVPERDPAVVSELKREEVFPVFSVLLNEGRRYSSLNLTTIEDVSWQTFIDEVIPRPLLFISAVLCSSFSWLTPVQMAHASEGATTNVVYEVAELFELGIQLSYLLLLLALLGVGSFFVIRQVLVRRELDLSAKELQEQVRSGDASATELFELGAVMLRRKFYPAATKYLLQAIEKWDGDDQDLAQVHNALGVTYVRDGKLEKSITEFENAVKIQPGYVTAWNNLGDAYEKINNLKSALRAFEEVLLLDPNNQVARPRRDALKEKVDMYKGVPVKSKKK